MVNVRKSRVQRHVYYTMYLQLLMGCGGGGGVSDSSAMTQTHFMRIHLSVLDITAYFENHKFASGG